MKKKIKEKKRLRKEVRFNQKEFDKLEIILKNFKGNFSKFVKFHINNKFDYKENTPIKYTTIKPNTLTELSRIGNNFNQISRYLNTHQSDINKISFEKVQQNLLKVGEELERIELTIKNYDN